MILGRQICLLALCFMFGLCWVFICWFVGWFVVIVIGLVVFRVGVLISGLLSL